ncbi:MAG: NACHT domain-containing protein, partial [Cyanothece sp. SIO2G6]|nr:NACHT domain-containing protein [Cyanothece sp. SIO2G6]
MSRTTITDFFNYKPIGESSFRTICLALRLKPEKVSIKPLSGTLGISSVHKKSSKNERKSPKILFDSFRFYIEEYLNYLDLEIQEYRKRLESFREHCRSKISTQHSRMHLLGGAEVRVDQLYVDVWLLNRPPHTFQVSPNKLLETFDLRNDRLGLGDRIKRLPGFEVANRNKKLLILGKPGSGKTTFLKHIAVDWYNEKFHPNLNCIFIEIRQIRNTKWNFLEAIDHELSLGNREIVEPLLLSGGFLILIDGLDEGVTPALRNEVQVQLEAIVNKYPDNHFILTCRTQIMERIPTGFTSVEVADFNQDQVREFVQNWFVANGNSVQSAREQWERLNLVTANQSELKELTVTPVLLSLICFVLQDEGEIPTDRAWIYEKGIKLLLSQWNNEKQIEGWEKITVKLLVLYTSCSFLNRL